MSFTKAKADRLQWLRTITTPLPNEIVAKMDRLAELGEMKEQSPEVKAEREAITKELPPFATLRLRFMAEPEAMLHMLSEINALRYEQACHAASLENLSVLKDSKFLAACERAGVQPTRRQASKWRIGRRGAALKGHR